MIMKNGDLLTKQFLITVPAGKRLIAKAVISLEQITQALENNTIVIISGTTNSYVAEELLRLLRQTGDFIRDNFYRGITVGPGRDIVPRNEGFTGKDVVIEKGKWLKDKIIFDAAPALKQGDIIIKGANAISMDGSEAGILIGNSTIGSCKPILEAVIGKRVELIIPVGLEKRVPGNIGQIAARLNSPSASGLRMVPISGNIITELEAIKQLTGADAQLVAAGGVLGAEGSCLIAVTGTCEQLDKTEALITEIENEPPFGE
jgi:hypothetical protein